MKAKRVRVFDRPVWRDWLLWVALAVALGTCLVPLIALPWYLTADNAAVSLSLTMTLLFAVGFLMAMIAGSVVREFLRGRAEAAADDEPG